MLYYAHVHSLLHYCNSLWGSTSNSHLQSVILMQKRILRIISNSSYLEHTRPLFKAKEILTLLDLNKFINICEYFKINRNIRLRMANHSYYTRHRNQYQPPRYRTSLIKKSFIHLSPLLFHQLPDHIKAIKNIHRFKRELKKHLLASY